jgi:hypothetical protein
MSFTEEEKRVNVLAGSARRVGSVLGCGFFFFDVVVDETGDAPAVETAGRFIFSFPFGIAHEAFVKGLLGADVIVVVKSPFAAFTALEIFRHGFPSKF